MKIYAPVENTNGVYASVRFVNGIGETDDPKLIAWFKNHGYRIEEVEIKITKDIVDVFEIKTDKSETVSEESVSIQHKEESEFVEINKLADEPDFDSMTPLQIREWANANGYGTKIKNIRSREKLLDIIRG